MTASAASDGAPLLLTLVEDRRRNRLTTFFRAILAIPQFIVLYVLNIAVAVVVLLAWFAALFTGRNPESLRSFTIGVLRWQARVAAYYCLLTDDRPPFSLDLFFRIILIIPAALLSIVVAIVVYVLVIVAWLTGVFTGTVPEGVYGKIAGGLQYAMRYNACHYLITPTYPGQPVGPAQLRPPTTPTV